MDELTPKFTVKKLAHFLPVNLLGFDEQGRQQYVCPSCGETAYFDADGRGHCPVDEALMGFLRKAAADLRERIPEAGPLHVTEDWPIHPEVRELPTPAMPSPVPSTASRETTVDHDVVVQPWSAFPGAKPCLARPPEEIRRGQPLVCTRQKDHDGNHAVGIDGKIQWADD